MSEALKIESCRKLYRDIVLGYSPVKNPRCFVKHLREIDLGSIESKSDAVLEEIKANGIHSEKEVLESLDKRGVWTKKNEEEYFGLIASIKDLEQERKKIVSRSQAEELLEIIAGRKRELQEIIIERSGHLRISSEFFLRKKFQQELMKISFFKDEDLKEPLYDQETFADLDYKDLIVLFEVFNEVSENLCELNIKKVSVTPAFLNTFSLCESDPYIFYGKPVTELTLHQLDLFNCGKLNKTILEQGNPPPENYEDLDKVVLWYDTEMSLLIGRIEKNKRDAAHQH
mgnify:CR=1 FL=1